MRLSWLALLLLISSVPLSAAELTIRTGGERVVAFHGPSCGSTMYSPSLLVDPDPAIPGRELVMYTAGGILVDPCSGVDYMSPARFGDRIWVHYRDLDGAWRDPAGEPILDRRSFSWMSDDAYLRSTPGSYVGHLSSPSVVKVGQRYFMSFAATVNDPNLCAAEHVAAKNPCGSCRSRWSFFVAMWAVSEDGQHWRVFEGPPGRHQNRALNAALLWMTPYGKDVSFGSSTFKGVSRTSMIVREERGETYFYLGVNFWGRERIKAGMFRVRYDPGSEWGWSDDPEVWDSQLRGWRPCPGGQIPAWFNDGSDRGSVFEAFFANLGETSLFPGHRYIATLTGSSGYSFHSHGHGLSNAIGYQLSKDLVAWTPAARVESWIPLFADGTSYDVSVADPVLLEERGFYHFFFASADLDQDGFHDCSPERYPDHPTAPFIGMGIYMGTGNTRPLEVPVRDSLSP